MKNRKQAAGIPSPRVLSIQSLQSVFDEGLKPKDSLDTVFRECSRIDSDFAMEIVYGVLRLRDRLDHYLKPFLKNPEHLPSFTRNNLRTAIYQILFMRVPAWAAAHEAVNAEKNAGRLPSLVNAVLRSFLRQGMDNVPPLPSDLLTATAINLSYPEWLIRRWAERFGIAEARELAEAGNRIPPLTIRVDPPARETTIEALARVSAETRPTYHSPSGIIVDPPIPFHRLRDIIPCPFFVQDEAAQLVSCLLDPQPEERVLDLCAAPGGKSTHIALLMEDTGMVMAVDMNPERVRKITENARRLSLSSIASVCGDVLSPETFTLSGTGISSVPEPASFDRVLLDAPCSSLGVIRRNPDIKYRRCEGDPGMYASRQISLLRAAAGFLKKGGVLVYAVCSTEPEEGEGVVTEFLQTNGNFCIIDSLPGILLPFATLITDGGTACRTFPHRHGMDGFFMVKMRKI